MPTRTVAAGGGNFNVGATWVGGVVPANGDDIVANATSGNLTLTANTVQLIGANFTGYTGTLAFSSFFINFSSAGATSIILSNTMNITFTSGYFSISRPITITSNGKAIPLRYSAAGQTLTLIGDLTVLYCPQSFAGIVTGADVIITDNQPASFGGFVVSPGFKLIYRPTGSFNIPNPAFGTGYFVVDTNGTINSGGQINLQSISAAATDNTVEFTKSATWTGSNVINGKPNLILNTQQSQWNGATFSLIMTAPNDFNDLTIVAPPNNTINLVYPNKIVSDGILFRTLTNVNFFSKANINIFGSGGFSASNITIASERSTAFAYGTIDLRLDAGATYSVTNLDTRGILSATAGGSASLCFLSSIVDSVPATMIITNGAFSNTSIKDINNIGTLQYALSSGGNFLTRTTGFASSVPTGGAGSFTFVN